ncbi:hypothetical protein [Cytobacillus firmus]|uniref:hypothetical protein n=1 Tax=Cytobacillus firmus TaxID=1399 RepID=UPI0018CF6546|nr:hypothetical protein [Cytobacillus firmus]
MKKIKQKKTEKLSAYITKELSEAIDKFAFNNDEISRSKAIEILIKESLIKRGYLN